LSYTEVALGTALEVKANCGTPAVKETLVLAPSLSYFRATQLWARGFEMIVAKPMLGTHQSLAVESLVWRGLGFWTVSAPLQPLVRQKPHNLSASSSWEQQDPLRSENRRKQPLKYHRCEKTP
jgi:hypothetical protein